MGGWRREAEGEMDTEVGVRGGRYGWSRTSINTFHPCGAFSVAALVVGLGFGLLRLVLLQSIESTASEEGSACFMLHAMYVIGPLALHSGTLMLAFLMFDALTIGSENFDSSFVALKMFGSSKGISWTTNQIPNLEGQSTMFYCFFLICSYVMF
jgi:hypothetical protein